MQSTSPGSGSHSPFPIHTEVFVPFSINPGGHVYVMDCPSIGGLSSDPATTITGGCNDCEGG